jgi:hypothetical protein
MTQWEVKFEGKFTPVIIKAGSFLEAVEQAKLMSEKIISVQYICY